MLWIGRQTMSKGDITRQRIIEQAAPIFNQKGFSGCSMQDVMQATGLEKGGLYRHFASKEELAAAAFRYSVKLALGFRLEGLDRLEGARAKLDWMIRRFVEGPGPLAGGCPLLNTAVDSDDGNPVLRKLARRAFAAWKRRVAAIVAKGIEEGEFRRGLRPDQLAETIVAALEGGLVLSRIENSRDSLKSVEGWLATLLDSVALPRT